MKPALESIVSKWLKKRGWNTWYNKDYWVNPKCVADSTQQDYTNYGMDVASAFIHEVENLPPFQPMGAPELSKTFHKTKADVLEYYFGKDEK
jgi:hypothetical protein